jgi:nitroreductase
MGTISSANLLEQLNWRYATKKFDATKKIPADLWATLEKALVLSPSSFGLQPYRFLVIETPALRAALKPHSWGQSQITDASHLVVFARKLKITEQDITAFLELTARIRGVDVSTLNDYRDLMVGDLVNGPRSLWGAEWAARQTYIAFGNLMTSAALLGVDACPLEGLDPAKYDEVLGLQSQGISTVCACALGYRAVDDKYAALRKVRFPASELIKKL